MTGLADPGRLRAGAARSPFAVLTVVARLLASGFFGVGSCQHAPVGGLHHEPRVDRPYGEGRVRPITCLSILWRCVRCDLRVFASGRHVETSRMPGNCAWQKTHRAPTILAIVPASPDAGLRLTTSADHPRHGGYELVAGQGEAKVSLVCVRVRKSSRRPPRKKASSP